MLQDKVSQINPKTVIVGDFSTQLSTIDRSLWSFWPINQSIDIQKSEL